MEAVFFRSPEASLLADLPLEVNQGASYEFNNNAGLQTPTENQAPIN
jgi:hypothetical protein